MVSLTGTRPVGDSATEVVGATTDTGARRPAVGVTARSKAVAVTTIGVTRERRARATSGVCADVVSGRTSLGQRMTYCHRRS